MSSAETNRNFLMQNRMATESMHRRLSTMEVCSMMTCLATAKRSTSTTESRSWRQNIFKSSIPITMLNMKVRKVMKAPVSARSRICLGTPKKVMMRPMMIQTAAITSK